MWASLPLPQDSTTPCGEVSPEPLVPLVKKEKPGGTTSLPRHCGSLSGSPYSDLISWRFTGDLEGPATGTL